MCEPVSASMAVLAMVQTQQQQQAAVEEANEVNRQFEENNRMQTEAYNKDMEAYWDEEVNIQEEMFDNAEDAADAKLEMRVMQQQDAASMMVANAETSGGGATPQALLGNLRRSQLNSAMDLDETYQRGVVALGGEISALQRDKTARRNQAIGAINGAPRAGYQSEGSKMIAIGMAGASAYVGGMAMQGKNLFGSTSPTTTGRLSPGQKNPSAMRQRRIGRGKGFKSNVMSSNPKHTFGFDWRQRNPGTSGRGETQYSKWGFGSYGTAYSGRNYRRTS